MIGFSCADTTMSGQARVLLQGFPSFEDRVAFTGVQRRGLPLPLVLHLFQPGQVPKSGVVVFVELRVADVVFHGREIGVMRSSRAMLWTVNQCSRYKNGRC